MLLARKKIGFVLLSLCLAVSTPASASVVSAADLPAAKEPPALAPAPVDNWMAGIFVKVGGTFALNTVHSSIYSQLPPGGGPQYLIPNVGVTVGNLSTIGFEAGYYFTPNWSVNVAAGIPFFVSVVTNAPSPSIGPKGTLLAQIQPAIVPVTLVYHFTQLGKFQPYAGLGVAPNFVFGVKYGLDYAAKVNPSAALVLKTGADYMLDQHWSVNFDVMKVFTYNTAPGNDINVPGIGILPVQSTLKNYFQPWIFSAGTAYRFGGIETAAVVAKY